MAGDAAPEIELRPWSPDDLDLMIALLGDPAMTEHLGGPETPEALRKRLDRYLSMRPSDGRMFVIAVGPDRQPAGSVGYWPHESGSLETGWSVLPAFQGRGIATRGTAQCLDLAAAVGGYETIHAYPSVDNVPSNALSRTLGFELLRQERFEYPKGHWMTCNDWSLDLTRRRLETARYDIVGERVALGPVRRELYPLHQAWLNDPEVAWNVLGAAGQALVRGGARLDRRLPGRTVEPAVAHVPHRRGAAHRPRGAHRGRHPRGLGGVPDAHRRRAGSRAAASAGSRASSCCGSGSRSWACGRSGSTSTATTPPACASTSASGSARSSATR